MTEGVANFGRPYDLQLFAVSEQTVSARMATPVAPGQVTSAVNLVATYALER